jgi:signal peptidase I
VFCSINLQENDLTIKPGDLVVVKKKYGNVHLFDENELRHLKIGPGYPIMIFQKAFKSTIGAKYDVQLYFDGKLYSGFECWFERVTNN